MLERIGADEELISTLDGFTDLEAMARNILADFRERGAVALNGITQFLHVRPALESIQNAAEKSMQASNRAVARIDAFSTEYHEMGRHLKNMGRTLQGICRNPFVIEWKDVYR